MQRTVFYARIEIEHPDGKVPSDDQVRENLVNGGHVSLDKVCIDPDTECFVTRIIDNIGERAMRAKIDTLIKEKRLVVTDFIKTYLDTVIDFAVSVGAIQNFVDRLTYLSTYGERDGTGRPVRCELFRDHAPYSFLFIVKRRDLSGAEAEWKPQMQGGLIYDGPGCPNDGSAPAFTVSLASGKKPVHSWGVNT